MSEILRICPPEETFIDIKHHIKCPFKDCDKVVPQSGSLRMHLVKFHGVIQDENDENIVKKLKNKKGPIRLQTQYHCPMSDCIYGLNAQRHFSNINLLRQHYRKVHAEKKYECQKCGCGFGMEKDKRAHEERCGIVYKCGSCDSSYRSVEAILTHCKRKDHQLPEDVKKGPRQKTRKKEIATSTTANGIVPPQSQSSALVGQNGIMPGTNTPVPANVFIVNVVQPSAETTALDTEKLLKPLLPKPLSVAVIPIAPVTVIMKDNPITNDGSTSNQNSELPLPVRTDKNIKDIGKTNMLDVETKTKTVSTGTQVSPGSPRVRRNSINLQKRRKSFTGASATSTGMQTSISIIPKKKKCLKNVAQTQTAGDFILKTAMATAEIPIQSESVGTQITPKSKPKQVRSSNTCTIETQTSNTANPKRPRRKRLYESKSSLKTDSVCQTVDMNLNVPDESSCTFLAKSMVNESAQTVVMVDENSQTVPFHVLQNHLCSQNIKSQSEDVQKSYTASKILQDLSRNVLNDSDIEIQDNRQTENVSTMKVLSITEKDGLSVSVNTDRNSVASSEMCSFENFSKPYSGTSDTENRFASSCSSTQTQSSVCNSEVQASLRQFPSDVSISRTLHTGTDDASTSVNTLGNQNIGVKAFESDWINFLTQCDLYIANNGRRSFESQYPTTTSGNIDCATSVNPSNNLSLAQTAATISSTVAMTTVSNHSQISTTSTFSVQTDSKLTNFSPYPTNDMQVQTLTSSDDIDQLLNTACSSIQTEDTYSLMNIHTQTADDFDVLDLLMNNMETQTTDDLPFDGFSLADIETQTTNEIEDNSLQATTATQTQSGKQTIIQNKNYATNMETQTPYQGLFDFPMNKTQTTWQDLDEILSELNKNY